MFQSVHSLIAYSSLFPHHKHRIAKQQFSILPKATENRVIHYINYSAPAQGLYAKQQAVLYFLFAFLAYEAGNIAILFYCAYVPVVIAQVVVNIIA